MFKETSVLAVTGVKRLTVLMAWGFWVLVSGISMIIMLYKIIGIGLSLIGISVGFLKPSVPNWPFFLISAAIAAVFFLLMRFAWRKSWILTAALEKPLDEGIAKAAKVISDVEKSARSILTSVRKAIDPQQDPKSRDEP